VREQNAPNHESHQRLPHGSPRGFTLVELLVVIAIIGVLVGLLLPAVQAARESARQSQCGNNIKQWALGMQTYHDTYGALPLGATDYPCTKHTWLPSMWAFIEQIDLANRYDWSNGIMLWPNVNNTTTKPIPVSVARLPIYYCPSDRPNAFETNATNQRTMARLNYATNSTQVVISGTTYQGPFGNPNFNDKTDCPSASFRARGYTGKETTKFRNITDGLSKTLVLSEVNLITTDNENPVDPRGSMWSGIWFDTSIYTPNSGFDVVDSWYKLPNYNCQNIPPFLPCQPVASGKFSQVARSHHPGGVQAAFADGAVQFISDSIDTSTWRAIGTISGEETLSP